VSVQYESEGYSALDIPTSAALAYVREREAARLTARTTNAPAPTATLLLATDANCDLPSGWLREHNVAIIPVDVRRNGQAIRDFRDDVQCGEFALQARHGDSHATLTSEPLPPVHIRDHLQAWMHHDIDYVLQITFAATRSKHYLSALSATQSLVLIHNKVRRSIGTRSPLRAAVIDSQSGFTGEAVLVAEAVAQRDRGVSAHDIAESVKALRARVHTLIVPGELRHLANAALGAGYCAPPRWKIALARWFDIHPVLHITAARSPHMIARPRGAVQAQTEALNRVTRHVELGLSTPTVCLSYAGDLEEITSLPACAALRDECRRRKVELLTTTMSMTGCAYLGPGALAVSFISERFSP